MTEEVIRYHTVCKGCKYKYATRAGNIWKYACPFCRNEGGGILGWGNGHWETAKEFAQRRVQVHPQCPRYLEHLVMNQSLPFSSSEAGSDS